MRNAHVLSRHNMSSLDIYATFGVWDVANVFFCFQINATSLTGLHDDEYVAFAQVRNC